VTELIGSSLRLDLWVCGCVVSRECGSRLPAFLRGDDGFLGEMLKVYYCEAQAMLRLD